MKNKYKKLDNLIIFENGTIWREFHKKCKIVNGTKTWDNYLHIDFRGKKWKKHRLIMLAFNGESSLTVDHINGNKNDNRLCNLEYVTQTENYKRAQKIGLLQNAINKHKKRVLWNSKVYNSATELSLILNVSVSACSSAIKNGYRLKGHCPKYIESE